MTTTKTETTKQTAVSTSRKGKTKRESYTLRATGKTLLTTPFRHIAEQAAVTFFAELRSVSMIENKTTKTLQHWIYGRPQK